MLDGIDVRLLGPVEVRLGERDAAVGGAKQRTLIALLALSAGDVVSVEQMVEELWGGSSWLTSAGNVQMHVSRLRKVLTAAGDGTLVLTGAGGYRLDAARESVDVHRFEALTAEARAIDDLARRRSLLEGALGLWRGEPFGGAALGPVLEAEARRLADERATAQLDRIECDLALGHHAMVVGELEALVRRDRLAERPRALLMLALYRSGDQARALETYGDLRRSVVDELGIEPSASLRDLHTAILRQAPELAAPAATPRRQSATPAARERRQHRRVVGVGALLAILAAAAAAVLPGHGARSPQDLAAGDLAVIDGAGWRVAGRVTGRPVALAVTRGAFWTAVQDPAAVVRLDARTGRPVQTLPIGGDATALTAGAGAIWALSSTLRVVVQISPASATVVRRLRAGNGARALAADSDAVWVANGLDNSIWRIDPRSGRRLASIPVGAAPSAVAVDGGTVWVADEGDATVTRIDAATNAAVATVAVGRGPAAIATSRTGTWTANALDGTVSRIDPATDAVDLTVRVGGQPQALAATTGGVWVGDGARGVLTRLDPETGQIETRLRTGAAPAVLFTAPGRVLVAAQPGLGGHTGGTLTMTGGDLPPRPGSLDPAIAYTDRSSSLLAVVADGLVALRRAGGTAGTELVPDLARDLPPPAGDGRSYRFQLRSGLRFSDGRFVHPSDVRASIERLHRLGSLPAASFPLGLRGETACGARRCDLSRGIVADDATGTITFHLARPNPDFLLNLAQPTYAVLPAGTALRDVTGPGLVGTGPYRVAEAIPQRRVVLERNARFRTWSPAAQPNGRPDRIVWRVVTPNSGIDPPADLALDATPAEVTRLRLRDPARLHRFSYPELIYLWMNVHTPPFDRVAARRAVELATDRRALPPLRPALAAMAPSCRLLPPGTAGAVPSCPFGTGTAADLDHARRLVQRSGTAGAQVTIVAPGDVPARVDMARALVRTLRRIGYRATLDTSHPAEAGPPRRRFGAWTTNPGHRTQIGIGGWQAIFPFPSAMIPPLLSCDAARHPGTATTYSQTRFCDPQLDADMNRARALEATDPAAATAAWTRLDQQLLRSAPLIPLATTAATAVTSSRAGGFQYAPGLGPLIDQMWVR